ncbi:hypothetical protein EYC80_004694 [Monilinia laxa]|uniref:Uncharacterized protein n=1 Tax=Monilinia laxa TaxID=61186 RepID=A0A5N6KI22_MONLA|nr:hypothetical protein EYC80_004694 [Monilinia laxa]
MHHAIHHPQTGGHLNITWKLSTCVLNLLIYLFHHRLSYPMLYHGYKHTKHSQSGEDVTILKFQPVSVDQDTRCKWYQSCPIPQGGQVQNTSHQLC